MAGRAPDAPMTRADFVAGLAFAALGAWALAESLAMPRLAHLGVNPYSVPGLVPGALGVVIGLLGLALAVRAARGGGWRLGSALAALARLPGDAAARCFALALALTFGYAAGLVGRLPFWLATGLFVFAFTAAFEWRGGGAQWWRKLLAAALLAVAVAAAVTLVFRELFLVTLP